MIEVPARNCDECPQIKRYSHCNYECRREKKKIKIESLTMRSLKDCLENNFNLKISTSQISIYHKKIKKILRGLDYY